MRYLLVACLVLVGCRGIPSSVEDASLLESKLHAKFTNNIDRVVSKLLKAYRSEAYNNIDFRVEVAKSQGQETDSWEDKQKGKVQRNCDLYIQDYLRIKSDYGKAINLHEKIEEFLFSGKEPNE